MFNNNKCLLLFLVIINVALFTYLFHFWGIVNELKKLRSDKTLLESSDVFIPTDEWQPLKKDQPIPKGLHVRINLQTGYREAKLLSVEDKKDEDTSLTITSKNENLKEEMIPLSPNIEEVLKKIPNEIPPEKSDIKKKFRTYEELKKEMADLKLDIKTDTEVLNELMGKFRNLYITDKLNIEKQLELINLLKDLEYLLHQEDNARNFAKQDGMSTIIMPTLTANSSILQTLSARVIGAAVQNNGNVQVAALKAGVIPALLKNIALQKDTELRSSSLYALSCLIRSFPLAELKLIEDGGLSVLFSIFDETSEDSLKLQMKVVTLFSDLVMEKQDAQLSLTEKQLQIQNITEEIPREEFELISEKLRQYNSVGLNKKLIEYSWCSKLSHLMVTRSFKNSNVDENQIVKLEMDEVNHDIVDKIVGAVLPIINECQQQFLSDPKINHLLPNLLAYYKKIANEETDGNMYLEIFNKLNSLYNSLKLN